MHLSLFAGVFSCVCGPSVFQNCLQSCTNASVREDAWEKSNHVLEPQHLLEFLEAGAIGILWHYSAKISGAG